MIEKPSLTDESIAAGLHAAYALVAQEILFLPLGNDANAWAYRVRAGDGSDFFLKLRLDGFSAAALIVPDDLRRQGLRQAVAPLRTRHGHLSSAIGAYHLALYPWIEGISGMQHGMNAAQWTSLGAFLERMHALPTSAEISATVERETFHPRWLPVIAQIQALLGQRQFEGDSAQNELAAFWRARQDKIDRIVRHAAQLGERLRAARLPCVLCHCDIHTANVMLDRQGDLRVVDWDQPALAPRERDLMFFCTQAQELIAPPTDEVRAFAQGYGRARLNQTALAYYHAEWVVQEIGDYGERVFLRPQAGDATQADAVRGFRQLFDPGDVVETARRAAHTLRNRLD